MKRRVMMNRMVHKVKTHHESFDEGGKIEDEEYEIDEVIPGTESAFFDDIPSSESSSVSSSSEDVDRLHADIEETEEVLEDGTVITKTTISKDETYRVHSRTGSIDETHQTTVISEEKITPAPSPRSGSPVAFEHTGEGDMIKSGEHLERIIKKTIKEGHFDAKLHGDTLETTSKMVHHDLSKPAVSRKEGEPGMVAKTISHSAIYSFLFFLFLLSNRI